MVLLKLSGTKMEPQRIIVITQEVRCHPIKIIPEEKSVWSHSVESTSSVSKSAVTLTGGGAGSSCSLEEKQHVWYTLTKVSENLYNICRVIIDMAQEEEECTAHLGKLSTCRSKLEMCGQQSMNIDVQCEGRKQDKQDKLLTTEEVCTQVQKEERTHGLLTAKEGLTIASRTEASDQSTKEAYKKMERGDPQGEHWKKNGHTKERCWIVNPNLRSAKFK